MKAHLQFFIGLVLCFCMTSALKAQSYSIPQTFISAEYFVDTDPGVGNGTPLNASDGNIDQVFEDMTAGLTTSDLSVGIHQLFIRTKRTDGTWSGVFYKTFTVKNSSAFMISSPAKLAQAEYFVDTDPGVGNGLVLAATDGSFDQMFEDVTVNLNTAALSPGPHRLFIRTKRDDGTWSSVFYKTFTVTNSSSMVMDSPAKLTQAEYFVDTDPGAGNGQVLVAEDGSFDQYFENVSAGLNTASLNIGPHVLYIRTRRDDGAWSDVFYKPFHVTSAGTLVLSAQPKLTQAEYFIDADPGQGSGTVLTATDGALDQWVEDITGSINTPSLTEDVHTLQIRFRNSDATWGSPFTSVFEISNITAPAQPVGLAATARNQKTILNWNKNTEPDINYYIIYQSLTPGFTPLAADSIGFASGTDSAFTVTGLTNGITYYYKVSAVDIAHNVSTASGEISSTPFNTAPVRIKTFSELVVYVNAPDTTLDSIAAHFTDIDNDVLSFTLLSSNTDLINAAIQNGRVVVSVISGISGTGKIYFSADDGLLSVGDTLLVTVLDDQTPAAPQNLSAVAGDGEVTLNWTANSESDLLRYRIYMGTQPNPAIQADSATGNSKLFAGLTDGQSYYFRITAVDTAFNQSVYSNEVNATPIDLTAPSAPQNLSAVAGDGEVTLNWTANAESDLLRYRIYMGTQPDPVIQTDSATGNSKLFSGLTDGQSYYFRITAVDTAFNQSVYSNEVNAIPVDLTAPSAPQNLSAVAGDGEVTLNWTANAESDLLHYRIYMGTQPDPVIQTDSATGNSKLFSGLTDGQSYYFRITAVDTAFNQSVYSNEVNAIPVDLTAPSAPQNLSAVAGDGEVTLNWTANAESDLLHYRIYMGTQPNPAIQTDSTTGNSKLFEGLTDGQTYYFRITAVDTAFNQSVYSNEVNAIPVDLTAPFSPQNLSAVAGDGEVTLNWVANAEPDLLRYRVYMGTQPNPVNQTDSATGNSKLFSGLTDGQTYYFRISAVDTAFNQSAYSDEVTATPVDLTAPSAPQNLSAVAGDGEVTLNWTANSETDLLRYRIFKGTAPNAVTQVDSTTIVSRTISGLTNGQTCYFRISAIDTALNQSIYSDEISVVPVAPIIPLSLTASVFQNPAISQYADVVVIADTTLIGLPVVSVKAGAENQILSPSLISGSAYKAPVEFTHSGSYTITAHATSITGSKDTTTHEFSVTLAKPGTAAKLMSTDGEVSLNIDPHVISGETYFITETKSVQGYAVYQFGPMQSFSHPLTLRFYFDREKISDPNKLFVYREQNGVWVRLRTQVYAGRNEAVIRSQSLGKFRMGVDESFAGSNQVPEEFGLKQNYPNPFNPATTIAFDLAEDSRMTLTIYNLLGQRVKTLYQGNQIAGSYRLLWDGTNEHGSHVSSGMYFYRLETDKFTHSRKMLLIK